LIWSELLGLGEQDPEALVLDDGVAEPLHDAALVQETNPPSLVADDLEHSVRLLAVETHQQLGEGVYADLSSEARLTQSAGLRYPGSGA
jgi:hypothetical protein